MLSGSFLHVVHILVLDFATLNTLSEFVLDFFCIQTDQKENVTF